MLRFYVCKSARRGVVAVTLLELSIVLGIVGALLGSVWLVSGSLWSGYKAQKASMQVNMVSQKIREYASRSTGILPPGMASACGFDMTQRLDAINIFPSEMRSFVAAGQPVRIVSPFASADPVLSNTFSVRGSNTNCIGNTAGRFRIVLTRLKRQDCVKLLMSGINYRDQSFGVSRLCAAGEVGANRPCYNGVGWMDINCVNGVCNSVPAMTALLASTRCNSASANEVGWEMKVHENVF